MNIPNKINPIRNLSLISVDEDDDERGASCFETGARTVATYKKVPPCEKENSIRQFISSRQVNVKRTDKSKAIPVHSPSMSPPSIRRIAKTISAPIGVAALNAAKCFRHSEGVREDMRVIESARAVGAEKVRWIHQYATTYSSEELSKTCLYAQ